MNAELASAAAALAQAELAEQPAQRFLGGHLAALRVAAVVLAHRTTARRAPAGRPRDVWQVLVEVAPEYAEWAGFFASSTLKRRAVQAGAVALVGTREADDLLRDVTLFYNQVAGRLRARTAASRLPAELSVVERGSVKGRGWVWPSRELATETGCPEPSPAPPATPPTNRSAAS